MVEFVDLYPTLCELCHLPIPKNQLNGTSFVPILTNLKAKIKDQVYIQWEGETMLLAIDTTMRNGNKRKDSFPNVV